ncbi:hypothetical protein FEM03_23440 [Phragmitibacter flavus]|uniref:Uncharacterized protein n=1 Tax=Phragmitibacter flavus TaxID=2576071 RepID=A0A5R8K7D9_9BACT|nr:hypothetical protein FEM03_23440 [Phragmitibacter flavus]
MFIFTALLCGSTVRGDVVVLKSGQRYEGKVISEDATSVTMEYRPTPNTRDTRVVSKSDIQELIRLTPSQAEFAERKLSEILPTKDLLSAADYERIIQDQVRSFVNKYPGTPEAEEAEKIIESLSEEKERVSEGELKMNGKWLSKEDVLRDGYNIEAYRIRYTMNQKAAENTETRYLEAMRLFHDLQTQYPASLSYVDAVSEAIEILDGFTKQLNAMLAEEPILSERRANGLKSLAGPDAQATKFAVDSEIAAFKAQAAADKKNKVKWPSFYKYDAASMKSLLALVLKERTTLGILDVVALKEENETLTSVLRNLADEKVVLAKQQLDELKKSNPINKTAVSSLEKKAREIETELKERSKRDAEAKVVAQTTQSMGEEGEPEAADQQNALAKALLEAQNKKDKKKTDEETGDEGKTDKADGEKSGPKMQVQEDGGSSLTDYIPYIGAVLIVILLVSFVLGKKKPKEGE